MVRLVLAACLLLLGLSAPALASGPCRAMSFEDNAYTVCSFDLRHDRLALYDLDADGMPYGSFLALQEALARQGKTLQFAMNAGMFDEGLKPIGLYVEQGRQLKKVNRRGGPGNFHLKPNGIFYMAGDRGGVLETEAYLKSGISPDFATQSGPMLVIDGAIHPRLSASGTSAKRRNGVGASDANSVVFAISEQPVTFYAFARLFRDGLNCRNALFLDGSVSSLYDAASGRNDGLVPLGPMVGLAQ